MERRASDDLGGRLLRWVDASLITSEQAEAIRAFEEVPAEPRRVPLIAEALGYLGAALALAAGIVALGDSWQDLSDAARLGALGGAVVVLPVGGFLAPGSVGRAWGVGELVTDEKLFEFDVWIGPAIWLLGVAWLVLTKFEILLPEQTGYSIGAVVALLGPMFREEDQLLGAVLGIGR